MRVIFFYQNLYLQKLFRFYKLITLKYKFAFILTFPQSSLNVKLSFEILLENAVYEMWKFYFCRLVRFLPKVYMEEVLLNDHFV